MSVPVGLSLLPITAAVAKGIWNQSWLSVDFEIIGSVVVGPVVAMVLALLVQGGLLARGEITNSRLIGRVMLATITSLVANLALAVFAGFLLSWLFPEARAS